ncbi:peptidase M28 [Thiorhodococcus drewsii AZ1]|uniref:Peptidase M28 n=1 Tax=Thiorhodococcus drewsii AZ1 TaxID=765913 RepID=G2E3L4_9GAMM|nr:M1 family aminopeptidase [Thiorhodococcus drewsii]EGV30127.1 peptidase M28 [Thiorhodococcus drewsii AZ1]
MFPHRLQALQFATPLVLIALALMPPVAQASEAQVIEHRLSVNLDPAAGHIRVQDQMRFPEGRDAWTLLLHSGLDPTVASNNAELIPNGHWRHLERFILKPNQTGPVTLTYGGTIQHGLQPIGDGMGRARHASTGTIQPNGVFLDSNSAWYPLVPDTLQRFALDVELPTGWIAVSQGEGPGDPASGHSVWREAQPQNDIYLVAGPFKFYRKQSNGLDAQVYLRHPDPELARRYLDATLRYVRFYSDMIGPYPYAKFALVENFWESGYGMPSFTLLGPQVIRLPFIIHTSFPHEILHNWWGNSVYVDYASGNWSEGITNYLADYWMKEQKGQGTEQRRDMLKDYADYVRASQDFPLTEFRANHGSTSQSIGYNKGAMLFHMLRRQLGEETFKQALRRFYRDNRFRAASYADWRLAFESVSGRDLGKFFSTWTQRTGAPRLELSDAKSRRTNAGFEVTGTILQTQPETPFPLQIPILIEQRDGAPVRLKIASDSRETAFTATLDSAPTRVAVDPEFDLFRQLLAGETPATLSNLFGSEQGTVILPTRASKALLQGYRQLAETWVKTRPDWTIRNDAEVSELPNSGPVLLLGWENALLDRFTADPKGFVLNQASGHLMVDETPIDPSSDSLVLTRLQQGRPVAWLATEDAQTLPALARKVPHYGRYSYLVFAGPEATNRLKGQWPSGDSALAHRFTAPKPH